MTSTAPLVIFGDAFHNFIDGAIIVVENAVRVMRETAGPGRPFVITFLGSFHGRTMGSLTAPPRESPPPG